MTKLPTVNIKGKAYVAVNDRLKYFREKHAGYSLETEIISVTAEDALMRAVIRDDNGRILATGIAREVRLDTNSFVNKTSYVENCETSAWGRALANFGIGIDETVASADEVANAVTARSDERNPASPQKPASKKPTLVQAMEYMTACKTIEELNKVHERVLAYEWSDVDAEAIGTCFENVQERIASDIA